MQLSWGNSTEWGWMPCDRRRGSPDTVRPGPTPRSASGFRHRRRLAAASGRAESGCIGCSSAQLARFFRLAVLQGCEQRLRGRNLILALLCVGYSHKQAFRRPEDASQ